MKRSFTYTIISLSVFVVGVELIGRYMGLHHYPLYVEDTAYEYIHAPNQDLRIYRNKFSTNAYSMRSLPFRPQHDTLVILLIGDSIINGGNQTDQDSLASTLLEQRLQREMGLPYRVLNIGAGSWGPNNAATYLTRHGTFNADMVVLVASTHDAVDNMTFRKVVGIYPNYPATNYSLAWYKVIERGLQQVRKVFREPPPREELLQIDAGKSFNAGFQKLYELTDTLGIPFVIYLHSTRQEMTSGNLPPNADRILSFADSMQIAVVNELDLPIKPIHYRDDIHFNHRGQRFLSDQLFPVIRDSLLEYPRRDSR